MWSLVALFLQMVGKGVSLVIHKLPYQFKRSVWNNLLTVRYCGISPSSSMFKVVKLNLGYCSAGVVKISADASCNRIALRIV
jgi:hypothetical protein